MLDASESPKPRRVLIGTPSYDGKVTAWFANSLVETVRLCETSGIRIEPHFLCHEAFVHSARNEIMKLALTGGFDDLIFIDADQDWLPQWVPTLLSYPVDCVGGTVHKKQDVEAYNVRSLANPVKRCPNTGLLMVDGLGGGFLRLSRNAIQRLWDISAPYEIMGKTARMICEMPIMNGKLIGEDTVITLKLASIGIPTYLDPAMSCGHVGTKRWKGDFAAWLAKVEVASTAPEPETVL